MTGRCDLTSIDLTRYLSSDLEKESVASESLCWNIDLLKLVHRRN